MDVSVIAVMNGQTYVRSKSGEFFFVKGTVPIGQTTAIIRNGMLITADVVETSKQINKDVLRKFRSL